MKKRLTRTWLAALLLPWLTACNGQKVERVLVYQNTVYDWRIEHVVAHN